MENFIMNKKYLWINILLMIITYGIWIIVYFYLKHNYTKKTSQPNIRTFSIHVAGVTFKNDDGTDRQTLISKLSVNQELKLVPYKFDNKDAIYVKTLDGKILGNIPTKHTIQIHNKLLNNSILKIVVSENEKFKNENNEYVYYLKIKLFIKK